MTYESYDDGGIFLQTHTVCMWLYDECVSKSTGAAGYALATEEFLPPSTARGGRAGKGVPAVCFFLLEVSTVCIILVG